MDDELPPAANDNEVPETNIISFDQEKMKRNPNVNVRQPRPPQNDIESLHMENLILRKKLAEMTYDRVISNLIGSFVNNGVPLSSERKDMSKILKLCFDAVEGVVRKYYRLPSDVEGIADSFYSLTNEGTVIPRFGPKKDDE